MSARPSLRPSVRAVLATTASAALLVGGASLASYAASGHGHGLSGAASGKPSAEPKTLVYSLGTPGQVFHGSTQHLFTAKVPKGTYQISLSGIVVDQAPSSDSDNISCVLVDKKTLTHLAHSGSLQGARRLYAIVGTTQGDSSYGYIDQTDPAAKVDRVNVVYGCAFNGTGPFQIVRPLQFTLTPVKVSKRNGTGTYHLPTAKVRDLARALR